LNVAISLVNCQEAGSAPVPRAGLRAPPGGHLGEGPPRQEPRRQVERCGRWDNQQFTKIISYVQGTFGACIIVLVYHEQLRQRKIAPFWFCKHFRYSHPHALGRNGCKKSLSTQIFQAYCFHRIHLFIRYLKGGV